MAKFKYESVPMDNIGTTPVELIEAKEGQILLLTSLSLTNKLNTGITTTVEVFSSSFGDWITIVKNAQIPKGSTLPALGSQKITLNQLDKIRVSANQNNAIDARLSLASTTTDAP